MRTRFNWMAAAAVASALTGCASTSPDYDAKFGDGVRSLNAQQAIDPQAAVKNAGLTPASDGRTVREGMERMLETYKSPPQPTIIGIGVGAGR